MDHARAFLKVGSSYASAEEVRLANTVNSIIGSFEKWHWNVATGTGVSVTTGIQDYTIAAADQLKVLAIQDAYLSSGATKYPQLLVHGYRSLPNTGTSDRPLAVCLMSQTALRLWPNTSGAYTLNWKYYKQPTVFTANTESFDCPDSLRDVVKAGMIWQLLSYQDDARSVEWNKTFYDFLTKTQKVEKMTIGRNL